MILVIDIETSGPSVTKNGILAIGYCLGDLNGRVYDKRRIDLQLMDKVFDEQCKKDFWETTGPDEVLKTIQQAPLSPKEAMSKFILLLDDYDTQYHLTIMSDNPSFDFYFINYYMDIYADRRPINYQFGKTYRPLINFNSFSKGRFGACYRKHPSRNLHTIKHDHYPENDAEFIYGCYIMSSPKGFPHQ